MTMKSLRGSQVVEALARALDTERMRPLVAEAAGIGPDPARGLRCDAELLSQKAGDRWVIRYRVGGADRPPIDVLGKLYRRRWRAWTMYHRLGALGRAAVDVTGARSVQAPLGLERDLGLLLLEYVEGQDLRHAASSDGDGSAFASAAGWLARLHQLDPLPRLRHVTPQQELAKASVWCATLAARLPDEARRLARTDQRLQQIAASLPGDAPAMVHRDFYYANVLWDGRQVWVLDLDQMRASDPALDVGHFLAHLDVLAYRTTGDPRAYAKPATRFLLSYEAASGAALRERLPAYRAYTFLKLAATEAKRRRPGWDAQARVLIELAGEELERAG